MIRIPYSKYVVYTHSVNGKIFYVGAGQSNRPFVASGRNEKWSQVVRGAGFFDVDIIGVFDTFQEAEQLEALKIVEYEPYANVMYNRKSGWSRKVVDGQVVHTFKKFKSPIIDTKTGREYVSVARAAYASGIPGHAIRREVNNKQGVRFRYKKLDPKDLPQELSPRVP